MSGGGSRTGVRGLAWIALGAGCVVASLAHARVGDGLVDPVRVYYDGGDCGSEAIDVEVFDREADAWIAHPLHPRIPVPSCQVEDAGQLLNELRWRCDTADPSAPAPWRSLPVFDDEIFSRCVIERILEGERERIRDAQRKRLELEPEGDTDEDGAPAPDASR